MSVLPSMNVDGLIWDVLVIGSGASGRAAAVTCAELGLDVIVVEKEPVLGGTSAWSGGWLWIPRNPLAVAEGTVEEFEQVRTYLRNCYLQLGVKSKVELGSVLRTPRV